MPMDDVAMVMDNETLRQYIERDLPPKLGVQVKRRLRVTRTGLTEVKQRATLRALPVVGGAALHSSD